MKVFGYKLSHILNPKRWFMFLSYKKNNAVKKIPIAQKDAIAFAELVMYRALTCPQCVSAGKCIGTGEEGSGCGCEINGLTGDVTSDCGLYIWGGYTKDNFVEEWNKYKKLEGISFELKRGSDL